MITTALVLLFTGASVSAEEYNLQVKNRRSDSFVLTWDSQPGADAYRVYVYNDYTRTYKRYKTVAHEKVTFDHLYADTTYKIKIFAMEKVRGRYVKLNESGAVTVTTNGDVRTEPETKDLTPKKEPTTRPENLRNWDAVYDMCGNSSMADTYISNYLNKFKNAGYTVEVDSPSVTSHRILFNGQYVGTAYTYKTPYIPAHYANVSYFVELYFGENGLSRPTAFSSLANGRPYYGTTVTTTPYVPDYSRYFPDYYKYVNDSRYRFTDTGYYFNGVYYPYSVYRF